MQVPLGVGRAPLGRESSEPLALLGGPTRSNMEELTMQVNNSCTVAVSEWQLPVHYKVTITMLPVQLMTPDIG